MPRLPRPALVAIAVFALAGVHAPSDGQTPPEKPVRRELEVLGDRAVAAVPGAANKAFADQATALASTYRLANDAGSEARAWQLAGYFSMLADENVASAGYSDRALGICRRTGDLPCVTRTAINAAVAHKRAQRLPVALERLKLAIAVAKQTGETKRAEQARYNLANVQHALGDVQGALATFDQLGRDYPDSETALGSLLTAARIHVEFGQAPQAVAKASAALALLDRNSDVSGWTTDALTTAQSTAGLAHALAGDQRRALEHLDRALIRAHRSDSEEELFDVNSRYAWAWLLMRRADLALPYTRTAFALRDTMEGRDRLGFLDRAALVFEANGDSRSASAARGEALEIAQRVGGAGLQAATASAVASVGLDERNMLVSRLQFDRAEERAKLDRTRLFGLALLAGLLLVAVVVAARVRFGQLKRQQAAVLDERTRVARDLHDTLIQGFTGVTLQLQQAAREASSDAGVAQRLRTLANAAATSLREARNAVWQIRSEAVERGELREAIEGWLGTVNPGTARLSSALDALPPRLPRDVTEDLLRFVQEAVTNALRHADAKEVAISSARPAPRAFELAVTDNGRGFDPASTGEGHWGLIGMRERVERAGGRFTMTSQAGAGTRVAATVGA